VATRLIPLSDIAPAELGAWDDLAARAAEPNPFFEADFVLPAARRPDAPRVALLVAERQGGWVACLPVRLRGTPPMTSIQAWCHEYCFLGTPLVDRDAVGAGVDALLHAVRDHNRFLVLDQLALDGPVGAAVEQAIGSNGFRRVFERRFERACVVRRSDDQQLELSSSSRRTRRRQLRGLEQELGAPPALIDRSGSAEAVEEFLRMEASGWKGKAETAFASSEADGALFREVWAAFTNAGRFRILELGTGASAPAAMYCDILAGEVVFSFKMAFDERYRAHGPGVELLYASIEDFLENRGERLMDSCADSQNALVNRLMPDRRPLTTVVVGPAGPRTTLARGAARAATAVRKRGRVPAGRA
jgi:CelD/BcsL family acetyltransferase involved in cellulose biosynthesis